MSFLSVGLAAALAWFLAIDAVASLLVAAIARPVLRPRSDESIGGSPATLLALRLAPCATALLFVIVWVAPAYWQFEPRQAGEQIGVTLAALAAAAAAMVAASLWRTASAVARTARVGRLWTARSDRMSGADCPVPVYDDSDESASVALVGVVRPRLFIGRRVRRTLTRDELSTVVAHELAHRRRFDNLTRLLLAGCRDALSLFPVGRRLESAWKAAAEQSADSGAAAGDRTRAVHLASALVKVARLMPPQAPATAIWSSLHDLHQDALLPVRVRRLLAADPPRAESPLAAVALSLGAVTLAVVFAPAARPIVHEATELLVRALP